ncbi:MAG: histidine--tRNA ligase [Candidatus Promineifilaceae bacterium]
MQDVLPDERRYWDAIIARASDLARRYGFERLDVPILEYAELFSRGTGTASDFFVQKEMYTLDEEDETSLSLRPEFTAGMVRAYLENGLASWPQPVKLYTIGPLFRRERPQAGRYRQHTQINAEIINEGDPAADLEVMLLAKSLHRELGYAELAFQLNSTGCPQCKPAYVALLKAYLTGHDGRLAEVDRERLRRNPLRVLDSKEPGMEEILAGAPKISDHLCAECAAHFAELRALLEALGEPFRLNHRLVRGIDYYTKTVFELWDASIGAQAALCGGGRYDGLSEALGGPSTPGVGVGIGVERIAIGMRKQGIEVDECPGPAVMVVHLGAETKVAAVQLVAALRQAGLGARLAFGSEPRSLKSQLREAGRRGARFAVIVGADELAAGRAAVRDMAAGSQEQVALDELAVRLSARLRPESADQ